MSGPSKQPQRPSEEPDEGTYKVGKKRPPKHTQFQKGVSGNPRGRPRHSQQSKVVSNNLLRDLILAEAREMISVQARGGRVDMPAFQIALRRLRNDACEGNFRAMKLFAELVRTAEQLEREDWGIQIDLVRQYKNEQGPQFDLAQSEGWQEPAQLPHPAHVNPCFESKQIILTGPVDLAEKEIWEMLKLHLRLINDEIEKLKVALLRAPRSRDIPPEIARLENRFERLEQTVPPGWDWQECVTDFDRRYYDSQDVQKDIGSNELRLRPVRPRYEE